MRHNVRLMFREVSLIGGEFTCESFNVWRSILGAPYVSTRRLVENSMSALLGAVELYNKPTVTYRDEVTVMLIVNAWELALKAALRQAGKSVFYRKKRGEQYRSFTLDDCLNKISEMKLWPSSEIARFTSTTPRDWAPLFTLSSNKTFSTIATSCSNGLTRTWPIQ